MHIIASVVLAVVVVDLFVRDLKLGVLTLDLINFNVFVNLYLHVIALHDSNFKRSPQFFFIHRHVHVTMSPQDKLELF